MGILLIGLVIFLGVHSLSMVNEPWRDRMAERIGEWPWKGLYAAISLVGLVAIVYGYGLARQAPQVVYSPAPGLKHLAMLLMVPVFPLLVAPYLPGRIKRYTKHPMLIAVLFWAGAHLLINGTLADILLFGSFLVWAGLDLLSMRKRQQRPLPGAPAKDINDLLILVIGMGLYVLFIIWLHEALIGVRLLTLEP